MKYKTLHLYDWLKKHPLISRKKLAKTTNISLQTIKSQTALTDYEYNALVNVLSDYGYKAIVSE